MYISIVLVMLYDCSCMIVLVMQINDSYVLVMLLYVVMYVVMYMYIYTQPYNL